MREQARQGSRFPGRRLRRRRDGRRGAGPAAVAMAQAVAAGILTAGLLAPPAASAAGPDGVQRGLNALVRSDGMPAALAGVEDTARCRS